MEIIIKDADVVKTLTIVDPKTGVDYSADFIGNTGALNDGQFVWDESAGAYVCDQDTFDWWQGVIEDNQRLNNRIHELTKKHGQAVHDAIVHVDNADLENYAERVNQVLDEDFM